MDLRSSAQPPAPAAAIFSLAVAQRRLDLGVGHRALGRRCGDQPFIASPMIVSICPSSAISGIGSAWSAEDRVERLEVLA